MKKILLVLALVSSQVYAHREHEGCCQGHSYAQKIGVALKMTPALVSVLWNGGEIINHGLGFFGIGEQCHEHEHHEDHTNHGSTVAQYWHAVEILLHGANLIFSGLDLSGNEVQSKKAAALITGLNILGAYSQAQTTINRHTSWTGILMAPFSVLDFFGHLSSALSSVKPLF